MSKSKYIDTTAIVNVIGGIFCEPSLLDNENYYFHEDDFSDNEFHLTLFGAMYNLHQLGAKEITINAIEDYLEQRPKRKAIYDVNKGGEYLTLLKDHHQFLLNSIFWFYHCLISTIIDIYSYPK